MMWRSRRGRATWRTRRAGSKVVGGEERPVTYLAVLLAILVLLPFGLQLVIRRQQAAPPLQQFYVDAYRRSCSVVRRPLVLPYVHQANGTKELASISDVVVLPPTGAGKLRIALKDAAVRAGARRVEFLRTMEGGLRRRAAIKFADGGLSDRAFRIPTKPSRKSSA